MDMFSAVGELLIARPLLRFDPDLLHRIVAAEGLVAVSDPGNADREYERVRWRPMLPPRPAPGPTAQRLRRFSDRMRDAESALVAMTAEALSLVTFSETAPEAAVGRDLLQRIPRAIAVRVVGRILDRVGGGQKPHALAAVEALTDRLIQERV